MNNDDRSNNAKMDDLLFLLVEGALDSEGIDRIEAWLSSGHEAKAYYLNFMNDYAAMKAQARAVIDMDEGSFAIHDAFDAELWTALAEVERAAERLPEDKHVKPRPELIQKVERKRTMMPLNKTAIMTIALSTAAIFLIVLFLRVSPPASISVATLTRSMDAVIMGDTAYESGSRLSNSANSLWLQKGVVTIEFDYGAEVVIEAPAEFCLNSPEAMTLRYGRLYARVPGRSKGFTVETPIAQIIDLGTEFAVKVDFDQTCEVHMIKGNASLIPGLKGQRSGESRILSANEATHVDRSGQVRDIPVKTTHFIREIDPETKFVWRGDSRLSLADIVGGGSGLGDGKPEYGINPETGVSAYRDRERGKASLYQGFQPVADNRFVDGVFCPISDQSAIQVSTQGHTFTECPLTRGNYWGYVMNSGWFGQASRQGVFSGNLSLAGTEYGSNEFPAITMHPNLGVTFDLDAIRQSIGHFGIDRFTTLCGISELVLEKEEYQPMPKASFYVLLDGVKSFESADLTPADGAVEIDIEIPETAQFLTLLVTEGSDGTYDGDWTLFAEPMLHLAVPEY
jgi:hypothetical protein